MSKATPITAAEIPAHMLADPLSRAQRKAFGKLQRESPKKSARKATKKESSDAPLKRSTSRRKAKAEPAPETEAE
jgi:hypothetical protein